jgi:hypothetical protein
MKVSKKQHRNIFRKFLKGTTKLRKKIFLKAPDDFIKFVGRCCKASLNNQLEISEEAQQEIEIHKDKVAFLSNNAVPILKKRTFLVKQSGGFLALILPAIFSAVLSFIGNSF